jgi:Tfp pilus assembly protein PilF
MSFEYFTDLSNWRPKKYAYRSAWLFRKALEIDPQLARAYVGLAYIYEYRIDLGLGTSVADNLTKLMDAARNAVRLDPNDGETQLVLGDAFAYQGMADQALEQYAKAEALAPNTADLLILIAWHLPQLGQPDRAVELTEKALKLNPNYPYWYSGGAGRIRTRGPVSKICL